MYEIIIKKSADKQISKIQNGDLKAALKIRTFLKELAKVENPRLLNNAKKLEGFNNNKHYRWRIGNYRIVGIIEDKVLKIEIIKIATREKVYD